MKQYPFLNKSKIREFYNGMDDAAIRKSWGQNFLVDQNHIQKVIGLFESEGSTGEKEQVFEIGPGLGALSWTLLEAGFRVVSLEIDPILCGVLNVELQDKSNFQVFHGDIRTLLNSIIKGSTLPVALVEPANHLVRSKLIGGNLPYYISSEIITGLVRIGVWEKAVFLLQTEFAQRAASNKSESSLSVFLSNFAEWKISHPVPASVFYPVPGVGSSVLVANRFPGGPKVNSDLLEQILRISFRGKRKKLSNAWKMGPEGIIPQDKLEQAAELAAFNASMRPDEIEKEKYFDLVAQLEIILRES